MILDDNGPNPPPPGALGAISSSSAQAALKHHAEPGTGHGRSRELQSHE